MTAQHGLSRPAYRPYRVHVLHTRMLSPYLKRIVVQGDDLQYFGTDGYDQRIKILLPRQQEPVWADPQLFDPQSIQAGTWYQQWRALDPTIRNPIRTYTIRAVDQRARTCTIDMVIHTPAGPAGMFAVQAQPGDELVIVGPDARSEDSRLGIDFHAGDASHVLLIGDETALPAIGGIIDALERDMWHGSVVAAIEIPVDEGQDYLHRSYRGIQVRAYWLPRVRYAVQQTGVVPHNVQFCTVRHNVLQDNVTQHSMQHKDTLVLRRGDAIREWCAATLPGIAGLACDMQHSDVCSDEDIANTGSNTNSVRNAHTVPVLEHIDIDRELLWEVPEYDSQSYSAATHIDHIDNAVVSRAYDVVQINGLEHSDAHHHAIGEVQHHMSDRSWDESWYAWVAGEAAMVRDVRRYLVQECRMDRKRVAFMGYWREGRSELG